jgi:hypothetical protein
VLRLLCVHQRLPASPYGRELEFGGKSCSGSYVLTLMPLTRVRRGGGKLECFRNAFGWDLSGRAL